MRAEPPRLRPPDPYPRPREPPPPIAAIQAPPINTSGLDDGVCVQERVSDPLQQQPLPARERIASSRLFEGREQLFPLVEAESLIALDEDAFQGVGARGAEAGAEVGHALDAPERELHALVD